MTIYIYVFSDHIIIYIVHNFVLKKEIFNQLHL